MRALSRLGEVQVLNPLHSKSIVLNTASATLAGFRRLAGADFDLLFVGFYGYLLVPLLRAVWRGPLVFDAFISTYDTLCFDRNLASPRSPIGRLAYITDRIGCRLSSRLILDTLEHKAYFASTLGVDPGKVDVVPVSCNEDLFFPREEARQREPTGRFRVLFYGSYLPLHGVETILKAVALLQGEAFEFLLVGSGPDYKNARRLAQDLSLGNLTFVKWLSLRALAEALTEADLCLAGPFGLTPKARRVIPGKLYQIMAMKRPFIAGDTPALRSFLPSSLEDALVPLGAPAVLADRIRALRSDPALRDWIAEEGRRTFESKGSERVVTAQLRQSILRALEEQSP